MVTLRPVLPEDAAALARLRLQTAPYWTINADTVRFRIARPGDRELSLVAEEDGEIIGHGSANVDLEQGPGFATLKLNVDQRQLRRGVGTRMLEPLLQHCHKIEASTLLANAFDDAGIAFAQAHGFTPGRVERISHLNLDHIPEAPVPEGFELTPLSALDGLQELYDVDAAVIVDVPSDGQFTALPFPEWKELHASDGKLNRECTVLAFCDGEPVGVSWLDSVDTRVWSNLTGTVARFRGYGLAKAMKVAALHLAREHGFTDAYASNDSANAAMLAVNRWLGYQPSNEQISCRRELL